MFGFGLPTIRCVYIPILNDECVEEELEDFSVKLSSEQDCVIFLNSTVEIIIIDDDSESSSLSYVCARTHMYTHTHMCTYLMCTHASICARTCTTRCSFEL